MIILQKILPPIAWMLLHASAGAQTLYYPFTPAIVSSARYGQSVSNPLVAALNPAASPYINKVEAGLYTEKKYMTDINAAMLAAGFAFDNNGVGILLQHFGNGEYSERTAGIGYGKRIGKLNIGLGIRYISINIQSHDKVVLLHTIVTSLIEITGTVTSSLRILNPNFFILTGKSNLRSASGYSLGVGWQVSPVVYTGIEMLKQEAQALSIIFNLQYQFAEKFSSSLSWSTASNQPNLCVGWRLDKIRFDAGCSYHAALGISPTICISYRKVKER